MRVRCQTPRQSLRIASAGFDVGDGVSVFRFFLERPEKSAVRIKMTPSAAIELIPRIGRLKFVT